MALSPAERLAIHDLYSRYATAADSYDGDAWAALFTEDGHFTPAVGDRAGASYAGREELAAFITDPAKRRAVNARLWTNNLLLTDHGDWVEGTCYAMSIDVGVSPPTIVATVTYRDEIVRDADGAWRFRRRTPVSDMTSD